MACRKGYGNLIKHQLHQLMSSNEADLYSLSHFKVLEVINLKTHPGQVNRTVSMNSHGTGFQASIGLIEMQGIYKLNGKVY